MARFQKPPDPRQADTELTKSRPRRQRQDSGEPIPWLWLGLGVLVSIVGVMIALSLVTMALDREPLAVALPTPTIIVLTAPATAVPSPTSPLPTPTPIPTLTPLPTPDLSIPPEEITIGFYAEVINAEVGVWVRGGPSTDNVRLELAAEGTRFIVIGGPREGSGLSWWQVRLANGTEGWVAANFLAPAARP